MFPEMEAPDFRELVLDIKEHGLLEDIITLNGMILEGRHRFEACKAAGVKPSFDMYVGNNPLAYVISKNLKRRHLNTGQRAMLAVEIAKCQISDTGTKANLKDAARQMNVSRDTAHKAKRIRNASLRLAKKVKDGKISLSEAEEKISPRTRSTSETDILDEGKQITPAEFQKAMDLLESKIPADTDHKKYGIIANEFIKRQMNFGKDKTSSAYTR